jgi:hypothetical protein
MERHRYAMLHSRGAGYDLEELIESPLGKVHTIWVSSIERDIERSMEVGIACNNPINLDFPECCSDNWCPADCAMILAVVDEPKIYCTLGSRFVIIECEDGI